MRARGEFRAGVLAEFESAEALIGAAYRLREEGYRAIDTFAPYDLEELDEALELRPSRLPWLVFAVAVAGAAFAYWVQWYTNVADYPLNAGGRPAHAVPAFVFSTFEGLVLSGAVAAVLGFLWVARLPRLWHPVFEVDGFERASVDRFWIGIDARDAHFEPARATASLRALAPRRVVWVEGGR